MFIKNNEKGTSYLSSQLPFFSIYFAIVTIIESQSIKTEERILKFFVLHKLVYVFTSIAVKKCFIFKYIHTHIYT